METATITLDLGFFYEFSRLMNEMSRNTYTEKEERENAETYFLEYKESVKQNKPTETWINLLYLMYADMDFSDYYDSEEEFIAEVEKFSWQELTEKIIDWFLETK